MKADTAQRQVCLDCGIPVDALVFDASRVTAAPAPSREEVLARFELPPQYCGVLDYFSQFTNRHGVDRSRIETPDLQWAIRINRRPLSPYQSFNHIVNPWGWGSFRVAIRLDEASTLELVVRGVSTPPGGEERVTRVGGRLVGRYWYNTAYGDVARRAG